MLVLSRKIDEEIFIGDDIRIVVVRLSADAVRLGIEAPKGMPIHRREVAERIEDEERNNGRERM